MVHKKSKFQDTKYSTSNYKDGVLTLEKIVC
jgi:hypothetical protein